ncbi:hypothetical protein HOD83_00790 [Candidatus Woesearchaeota archaeon]|jgi:tRNA threonylcarbamoyladenosine modification (KEOPS) complex  Pcc1 subunit|nr:hypothetical protein [Candidatus Woesearchaeota archaeon]MBT4114033.1 hypothetical protein [Candidatus Woesearchaeota archaeon]MBT4248110.1 hypothetical protein [Candidatus Woesearchaeota archaeon]
MIKSDIDVSGDKALLNACADALAPEQQFKSARAKYSLRNGKTLKIKIEAQDVTAFRAVMNSITSLLSIVNQNWRKVNGK